MRAAVSQVDFIAGRKTGHGFALRHDPLAADTLQNMLGAGYPIGAVAMDREKRAPVLDQSAIPFGLELRYAQAENTPEDPSQDADGAGSGECIDGWAGR